MFIPHALAECIRTLCAATTIVPEDSQYLCMESLFVAHYPSVMSVSKELWVKIVKRLNLNPKDFVVRQKSYFVKTLIEEYKVSSVLVLFVCLMQ